MEKFSRNFPKGFAVTLRVLIETVLSGTLSIIPDWQWNKVKNATHLGEVPEFASDLADEYLAGVSRCAYEGWGFGLQLVEVQDKIGNLRV